MFLVRKGNPKGIKDWDDLVKPGVSVITPNPEDLRRRAVELPRRLGIRASASTAATTRPANSSRGSTRTCPVLDSGARGSTTTFVERGVGDVLLAWENEAFLALKEFGPDKFEIVAPSLSILAEPPVAVVDRNVDKKGTRKVAEAYLQYLYSRGRPGDRRAQLLSSDRSEGRGEVREASSRSSRW